MKRTQTRKRKKTWKKHQIKTPKWDITKEYVEIEKDNADKVRISTILAEKSSFPSNVNPKEKPKKNTIMEHDNAITKKYVEIEKDNAGKVGISTILAEKSPFPSNVNPNVRTPFKKYLFWEPPKTDKVPKKKLKEKVPAVVSSKDWQKYQEKKEQKKLKQLEEKEYRKQKRMEKLKEKENNLTKDSKKLKQIDRTHKVNKDEKVNKIDIEGHTSQEKNNIGNAKKKMPIQDIDTNKNVPKNKSDEKSIAGNDEIKKISHKEAAQETNAKGSEARNVNQDKKTQGKNTKINICRYN